MNYWMTTHWPPSAGEDVGRFFPEGVWLPDGREQAGADLEIGDMVLVYESRTGRSEIMNIKGKKMVVHPAQGRQAIVAIAEVTGDLEELQDSSPSKYTTGESIWWRWKADTSPVSTNGLVPRLTVNRILGYKPGNLLRGFGDRKSGLKKLDEQTYYELVKEFKKHPRRIDAVRRAKKSGGWGPHDEGGESEEHKSLKLLVASDPAAVLGEQGLETIRVEYPFPCGDRADIVLIDSSGRMVGAEVEVVVDYDQLAGVLQAIKYRHMLALMEEREYNETRAFLIAKAIDPDILALCRRYDVECFIVD